MSEWKRVKLKEFLLPQPKSKIKAGEGKNKGKYKFFTSSNTQTKYIDEFEYEKTALIFGTGGQASIHFCDEPFATSTDCIVFYGTANVNLKMVYQYLKSNIYLLEWGFKGAGLKHISRNYILNLDIPLPPLEEQKRIANTLDKVTNLMDMRKQQIEKLDLLVNSWFMYNCAICSEKYSTWDKVPIEQLVENHKGSMRTGPFGSDLLHSEFVEKGVFVLGIDNAVNNYFSWNKMRYITEEKYEQLKRYTVHPEDVIVTIMGTVGRSAVIPKDIPKAINTKHLACLTLNKHKAKPHFIAYCLHSHPYVLSQIKAHSKGAIMDGLNLTIIKNIIIPLPPISIQTNFTEFLVQVEKQKALMQQGLENLELNYKALMQQYFE